MAESRDSEQRLICCTFWSSVTFSAHLMPRDGQVQVVFNISQCRLITIYQWLQLRWSESWLELCQWLNTHWRDSLRLVTCQCSVTDDNTASDSAATARPGKFRLHNTDPPVIHNTAASVLHRGPGFKLPRRRSARVFKLAARSVARRVWRRRFEVSFQSLDVQLKPKTH